MSISLSKKIFMLSTIVEEIFPDAAENRKAFEAVFKASPDFWDINAEEFERSARTWIMDYMIPPETLNSLIARGQAVGVWIVDSRDWEHLKYGVRVQGDGPAIRQLTEDELRTLVDERECSMNSKVMPMP